MDDNTTKVVMAVIALVGTVITPVVLVWVTKQQNKFIAKNQAETVKNQEAIAQKVEVYHKEVNGNMSKLLETTKELATAKEKVRANEEGTTVTSEQPTTMSGGGAKQALDQAAKKADETKQKIVEAKKKIEKI